MPINESLTQSLQYFAVIAGIIMSIALALAMLLLGWVLWQVKQIDLPAGADFKTALLATPFSVVLLLDLLDIGLNFMSAPAGWAILTYLGLRPLRGVAVVEGFLPGTEAIPTMTLAWIVVRLFKNRF
jgi:hypothetical protein